MNDGEQPLSQADCELLEKALRLVPTGLDPLALATALRRQLPAELARRAAELASLRERSRARFPSAGLRWLTRRGLEQSTRESVARERARRFAELEPGALVHDATCGLGADALALSQAGLRVLASDRDPALAWCARQNLAASPTSHCVFVADAAFAPRSDALLLLDPDRRATRGADVRARALDPAGWSPSPRAIAQRLARTRGACIKLPAGMDIEHCPPEWVEGRSVRWQWVSAEGELCEVNLWAGTLAGPSSELGAREVVRIPKHGPTRRWSARPQQVVSLTPAEVSKILWIADPDPAVVRAGLVGTLASELGLAPLAAQCAYLAGHAEPRTDLARCWRVLDQSSADPRAVRRMLAARDIGPVQVLKRGHPEPAEVLQRQYSTKAAQRGFVMVARLDAGHRAFLVAPADGAGLVGDEGFEPPTSSL